MVLESAEDQWRIPVTRGNFAISWALAGELSESSALSIASGLDCAAVVPSALGTEGTGAVVRSLGAGAAGCEDDGDAGFSVTIAPPSCVVFIFHQTPPAIIVATTIHTSSSSIIPRSDARSGARPKVSSGSIEASTAASEAFTCAVGTSVISADGVGTISISAGLADVAAAGVTATGKGLTDAGAGAAATAGVATVCVANDGKTGAATGDGTGTDG